MTTEGQTTPERPRRREPEIPQAPVALDERGELLSAVLPEVYEGFEIEVGGAVDEVTLTARPEDIHSICRIAKSDPRLAFNYRRCLSVVDYVERLEVNYHVFSLDKRHKMVIKANVSPEEPGIATVVSVWRGADWFEREGHDLFGVVFLGHPNLAPLLLYERFEGHPGLKSFPFHDYDEW